MIHDPPLVVARAVRMVKEHAVEAVDGTMVPLEAETICVHGDTPGAAALAARLRAGLEAAGILVKSIGAVRARTDPYRRLERLLLQSLTYSRYARYSRLAIRAPRPQY